MSLPFIGRTQELGTFRRIVESAGAAGRFIAVAGDAGMGKTRLMTEIARIAEGEGRRVLWSQVIEDPFAPPYFCWTLLLRAAVQNSRDETVAADAGSGAADLAVLVPELRDRLRLPAPDAPIDTAASRFQLFDAVTRFMLAAAERQPLVLLFDNLHLADHSSIEMLEYYAQHLSASPAVVVCAYRDHELKQHAAGHSALTRLSRTAGYERIELAGLSRDEVAALLKLKVGRPAPVTVSDAVFEQSDGNPLFVAAIGDELARHAESTAFSAIGVRFRVPESLSAVIAARLDSLPGPTAGLLAIASVLGRDFDSEAAAELSGNAAEAASVLEPAEAAGIVVPLGAGRFRFQHALFREVPYGALGSTRRLELHRRAAAWLERRYAADLEPHLPELAWHCFRSLEPGRQEKAVDYCRRAGDAAWSRRAFLEAATFYEQALQAASMRPERNEDQEFALLMALGKARSRGGHAVAASESLLKAALLAHRRRRWSELAEAMIETVAVHRQTAVMHVTTKSLLRTAIEHVAPVAPVLHARLAAALVVANNLTGTTDELLASFHEAVGLARCCNDDLVLIESLLTATWCTKAPAAERAIFVREAVGLARQCKRTDLLVESMGYLVMPLGELGAIGEIEELLPELNDLVGRLRHPHYRNVLIGIETSLAVLKGRWGEAMQKAREGIRQAPLQDFVGLEGRYGLQMFAIQRARGGLAAVAPLARRMLGDADPASLWLPGLVLLHCELGQPALARAALARVGRTGDRAGEGLALLSLVYLAEACVALKDVARGRELFEQLLPYRGSNVSVFNALMLGAVSGYLAPLAVLLRRHHEARKLFDEAIEMNTRMGALPALARNCVDYAGLLLASEREQDRVHARQLLGQAAPIAETLELQPVQAMIERLQQQGAGGSLTDRELEVLRLIADGASNKKISLVLDISHSTVATHVRNILRKIGASNRTEAAEYARRSALLDTPEAPLP